MAHETHAHVVPSPSTDAGRRWLIAAFALIVAFMAGEVVAGLAAHSLALLSDAGHLLTDAVALLVAVIAIRVAQRPARGAYTYGFARVDALSGQANGITLLVLAVWFEIAGVRRLAHPADVEGSVVAVVALIGAVVNIAALLLARRADLRSLNVRGAVAHLLTDAWAFAATLAAGVVVVATGWTRADALSSMVVGLLMAWTGAGLVRAAGRVFLEAAPTGVDPAALGSALAAVEGVAEIHDLHVWQIGSAETAASAHVLVVPPYDCHGVSSQLRAVFAGKYGIGHVTLQTEHADRPDAAGASAHDAEHCVESHGEAHVAPS
jgi:cobalt-zinc-cadmium efflux system protein